jgi:hypothetical protein
MKKVITLQDRNFNRLCLGASLLFLFSETDICETLTVQNQSECKSSIFWKLAVKITKECLTSEQETKGFFSYSCRANYEVLLCQ